MQVFENQRFDEERALYGSDGVTARLCAFDGPADGESAFKESRNIAAEKCFFNLRYPFWHDEGVRIADCEMTGLCRAALWYSRHIDIQRTQMHGIKALRECGDITIRESDIVSPEFGWSSRGVRMEDTSAVGEYFMLRAENLDFRRVRLQGKYSFQYICNATLDHCELDTKDAFWHCRDVVVRDSVVKGEYLAWYAENLTFERCVIIGTQPLCYCRGLKLIDCEMRDANLCFEKSCVEATLTAPVVSIKNPRAGTIRVPAAGEIILDDPQAKGRVLFTAASQEA